MSKQAPSIDEWLKEVKKYPISKNIGMYLVHNGVVRETPKAKVRFGDSNAKPVKQLEFSYDEEKVNQAIEDTKKLKGIFYIKAWLNEGLLDIGDDIMYILIGGDIRPNIIDALQSLVEKIKTECVVEKEIY